MLLEGKVDCVVCFPCSICLWITWVAGCRMCETRLCLHTLGSEEEKRLVSLLGFTDENKYWSHFSEKMWQWQWPYLCSHSLRSCLITKTWLKKDHYCSICTSVYRWSDAFWFLSSKEVTFYYHASKPRWAHRSLLLEHVAEILHSVRIGSRTIYRVDRAAVHVH